MKWDKHEETFLRDCLSGKDRCHHAVFMPCRLSRQTSCVICHIFKGMFNKLNVKIIVKKKRKNPNKCLKKQDGDLKTVKIVLSQVFKYLVSNVFSPGKRPLFFKFQHYFVNSNNHNYLAMAESIFLPCPVFVIWTCFPRQY